MLLGDGARGGGFLSWLVWLEGGARDRLTLGLREWFLCGMSENVE